MLYLAVVLVLSLSSINIINLYFINRVETYYNLKLENTQSKEKPNLPDETTPQDYMDQLYSQYGKLVLLWEATLTVSSILLFYLILSRHSEKEKKYREFLEVTILALSHKFGNFLSAMKVNVEITKSSKSERALKNMEEYLTKMQEEINSLIEILKRAKEENIKIVNIRDTIEQTIKMLDIKERTVRKELQNQWIEADVNILENILFILLHNSYKYSKNFIHIKMIEGKTLVIRNDIQHRIGGSGIGITIAERLCQLSGWKFKIRTSKKYFNVYVCF